MLRAILAVPILAFSLFAADPPPPALPEVFARASSATGADRQVAFQQIDNLVRQSVKDPALRRGLEQQLARLLASGDAFETRKYACEQLAIIGTSAALPSIANLFLEPELIETACLALTTYPPGEADDILRRYLPGMPRSHWLPIINTLGDRKDPKAYALFSGLAEDKDPAVAAAAMVALGKLGGAEALHRLDGLQNLIPRALRPALSEARVRCAEAFAASGDLKRATGVYESLLTDTNQPVAMRRAAVEALFRLDKDQGLARILTILKGSDRELRPSAIAAVSFISSGSASGAFVAQMSGLTLEEQVWMVESLGRRSDAEARAAVFRQFDSPSPEVRQAAFQAVARTGDGLAVPPLVKALVASQTPAERKLIEQALVSLADRSRTDPSLLKELKQTPAAIRALLIGVVALRMGGESSRVLLPALADPDPVVSGAAFAALGKVGTDQVAGDVISAMVKTTDPGVKAEAESAAARVLGRVEAPAKRTAIVQAALASTNSPESRASLLGLLPTCQTDTALNLLKAGMADSNPQVRGAALVALADWPTASAWDSLCAVLQQPPDETARGIALRGAVRMLGEQNTKPDGQLVNRYRVLLENVNSDPDRKLVLGAMGGAKHPGALQLALPLLQNPGTRAEAEVAVKQIAEGIRSTHPQEAKEALEELSRKP